MNNYKLLITSMLMYGKLSRNFGTSEAGRQTFTLIYQIFLVYGNDCNILTQIQPNQQNGESVCEEERTLLFLVVIGCEGLIWGSGSQRGLVVIISYFNKTQSSDLTIIRNDILPCCKLIGPDEDFGRKKITLIPNIIFSFALQIETLT